LVVERSFYYANINNNDEQLSIDDTKFIAELGWLTALSVSIVAAAAVL
jgi:hypothetical protein